MGSSARHTGRDISGQTITEITKEMADYSTSEGFGRIACEHCGAEPGDAEIYAAHIARVKTMSKAEFDALVVPAPENVTFIVREK